MFMIKTTLGLILATLLGVAAIGCDKDGSPEAAQKAQEKANEARGAAATEQREAVQATKEATATQADADRQGALAAEQFRQERDRILAESTDRLRILDARIATWDAKVAARMSQAQKDAMSRAKIARAKVVQLMTDLGTASKETWQQAMAAYNQSIAELNTEVEAVEPSPNTPTTK